MDRPRRRTHLLLAFVLFLSAAWFAAGIKWGLPSRAADPYLFGDRTPWTGAEIVTLTNSAANGSATRAADVDADPFDRSRTAIVNDTDQQRAEIVRRYRLYSYQPDEMGTFMALKEMKPGALELDPKFYKYGGLWVYPVGAILKAGALCRLIDVRADLAYYLDHPDAFGRFYVAARLYTVVWALVGVWVIFQLARRASGDRLVAAIAALVFAAMPVVVNAAHEAKPHLPGLVLTLLAVMAAARFVERGTTVAALLMGLACGAAIGMVPSALPAVLVVPMAVLLRRDTRRRRFGTVALAAVLTVVVYVLANPYVPINAIRRPEVLRSHFANSADFYRLGGWDAFPNAAVLLVAGMSPLLAAVGVVGVVVMIFRCFKAVGSASADGLRRAGERPSAEADPTSSLTGEMRNIALLLAAPAAVALVQFIAFAGGQPGDYGRFALLPDVALALAAVCVVGRGARRSQVRLFGLGTILLTTLAAGAIYVASFVRDAGDDTTRLRVAAELQHEAASRDGVTALSTPIEPAPFSVPPADLWRWRIELPPRGGPAYPHDRGVAVHAQDAPGESWLHLWLAPRLCWANKSFAIDYDLTPPPTLPPTTPTSLPAKK